MNVTVSCNVLSRWAQLVSVFSRTDSDIQISKNGLQLKLKLHQLWRTAMWLSHDCSWILTAACFSGDNVSLWTGVRSSSLGDNFWISLTALRLFCYSHFVIRQDHGFGSPREPHQLPGWLFFSCFYKSKSSYSFCAVIYSAPVICFVNCDYVKCW